MMEPPLYVSSAVHGDDAEMEPRIQWGRLLQTVIH